MPRLPRLHVPGGCYHVILRGNHREPLFGNPGDRERLAELVAEALQAYNARAHASRHYQWSSHRAYLGEESVPWVTTEFGLNLLGPSLDSARHAYARFMAQPAYASEDHLLEDRPGQDPRVLGTDRFIASLPKMQLQPRSPLTFDELLEQICRERGTETALVRSAARRRELTPIRVRFARMALQSRIASLQEIARYLNRTASSLSELLARYEP